MDEIKQETGVELIDRLENQYGYLLGPCVEDALRCIMDHANHPDSEKSWFDFTEERKMHREQYGYLAGRPSIV